MKEQLPCFQVGSHQCCAGIEPGKWPWDSSRDQELLAPEKRLSWHHKPSFSSALLPKYPCPYLSLKAKGEDKHKPPPNTTSTSTSSSSVSVNCWQDSSSAGEG